MNKLAAVLLVLVCVTGAFAKLDKLKEEVDLELAGVPCTLPSEFPPLVVPSSDPTVWPCEAGVDIPPRSKCMVECSTHNGGGSTQRRPGVYRKEKATFAYTCPGARYGNVLLAPKVHCLPSNEKPDLCGHWSAWTNSANGDGTHKHTYIGNPSTPAPAEYGGSEYGGASCEFADGDVEAETCVTDSLTKVAPVGATGSSTYQFSVPVKPANLLDGNSDAVWDHGSCWGSDFDNGPWARVELPESTNVNLVRIQNRGDCCADRMDGGEIIVGDVDDVNSPANTVCVSGIKFGATWGDFCCGAKGKFVFIRVPGQNILMNICGVEVFA